MERRDGGAAGAACRYDRGKSYRFPPDGTGTNMGRREELEYEIAEMRKRIDRAPENTPDEVLELWHQQLDSAWFELNNLYDDYETETE